MNRSEVFRLLRRMVVINLANSMAYRGDFVFYMLSVILGPIISVLIWQAAMASGAELPVDSTYLTSYFVLLGMVSMLTSAWLALFMAGQIREGRLSVWLARPGSFLYELMANNIAEKGFKFLCLMPMILVFAWFFRDSVDFSAPVMHWAVFPLCIAIGAVIAFSLDVIEGSLAFWIDDIWGIVQARHLVMLVLAGQLVPLELMPDWATGFMIVQPFRYVLAFPLDVIVGDLSGAELALGLVLGLTWAVAFAMAARWIWSRGKASYTAVGA